MVFWEQYKFFIGYLLIVNIITFIIFGVDKRRAIKQRSRIRVRTLMGWCLFGGSVGGLWGMYLFRHKTKKMLFILGVPLILLLQSIGIIYILIH